jgi:hypothetical protein
MKPLLLALSSRFVKALSQSDNFGKMEWVEC